MAPRPRDPERSECEVDPRLLVDARGRIRVLVDDVVVDREDVRDGRIPDVVLVFGHPVRQGGFERATVELSTDDGALGTTNGPGSSTVVLQTGAEPLAGRLGVDDLALPN